MTEQRPSRRLGRTGLQVSPLSFGAWTTLGDGVGDDEALEMLRYAHDAGILLFDHAETYGRGTGEEAFGRLQRKLGWDRETFAVCCKVLYGVHQRRPNSWGLGRKHIRDGCDGSLRRLGLDYIEILLCHRADPDVPVAETVAAMSDLVRAGKVLYWGTSEWEPGLVREADRIAAREGLVPPSVEQRQYNLMVRDAVEGEFAAVQDDLGIGLMTWSPLLYGLLAGRYDDGFPGDGRLSRPELSWLRETALRDDPDTALARIRAVNMLAREHGLSPAGLALRWVLGNRRVDTAIIGSSSLEQLSETVEAARDGEPLDPVLVERVDHILSGEADHMLPGQPIPRTIGGHRAHQ